MSFSGFGDTDLSNSASLKNATPNKKLKGRKITHKSVLHDPVNDPAGDMMPEENAPITDAQIRRAKMKQEKESQRLTRKAQVNSNKKNIESQQAQKKVGNLTNVDWHDNEPAPKSSPSPSPTPKASEPTKLDEKMDIIAVQKKQKELENENKLRRQALATEVQNRSRNILAEAAKLKKIEDEIRKLDELLSYDVSILRDKIDESSYEYSKTRARFMAAEIEFKESKTEFEAASKKKDDLTEALMTLIQENEERKKSKLENLVAKLNMGADELQKLEAEEAENERIKQEKLRKEAEERKKKEEEEKKRKEEDEKLEKERLEQEKIAEEAKKKEENEKVTDELSEKALENFEKEAENS